MEDLVLTASDDHVACLAHEGDPVRAIIELIWNAVDAEATNVAVTMERSSMEGIDQVHVEDDDGEAAGFGIWLEAEAGGGGVCVVGGAGV